MKNNNGFKRYVVPDRAYHTNAEILYWGNRELFGVTYRGCNQVAPDNVDLCNVALPRTLLSILVETDLPVDSDAERVVVQSRLGEIVRAAQATHLNLAGRKAIEGCTKLRDWYLYGKNGEADGKCTLCIYSKRKCESICPYGVIEKMRCWSYVKEHRLTPDFLILMRCRPNNYPAWRDLRIADLTRWIDTVLRRETCPSAYMKGVKCGKIK